MWSGGPLCLLCLFCINQVICSFSTIPLDIDPKKILQYGNVSNIDIKSFLKRTKELLGDSFEQEKKMMMELGMSIESREDRAYAKQETKERNPVLVESKKVAKKRSKRQTGKFSQAAKMGNLKSFRIYLTLFKNLFSKVSTVGGKHPMHPDVPKPIIILFKQRIMDFFFPPIGDEGKKA